MIEIQTFVVNYFQENTYLLSDETKEAILIDCGCMNAQEWRKVEEYITSHQLDLKHHLCTHVHVDHLMGAGFVYARYGLRPESAPEDIKLLPGIGEQARQLGLPVHVQDIEIQAHLNAGAEITFGNTRLQVKVIPGHSPGSIAFYDAGSQSVFVGDALFAGSIGRTDLWGGNYGQLIHSIETELLTLPDDTRIYPGHGSPTTVSFEKLNNPYI